MPDDEAFTIAEMAASLVVAAMLVSGLGEITRQFARTTVRVRDAVEATRDARLAQAEFAILERAEPGSLRVSTTVAEGVIGGGEARFSVSGVGAGQLAWDRTADDGSMAVERFIPLSPGARFERIGEGGVRLWSGDGDPPLLVVTPKRTAESDCQFDVVVRDCR